jgi:phosphoglycolate phosphatase-like HAD superfamily hydrolase
MKLVIFDLDGTLASTVAVDEECFVQAYAYSFGIDTLNRNWLDYQHVTDSGVIRESFANSFGRVPEPDEISKFIERFVGLLNDRFCKSVDLFGEVPGAASLLVSLRQDTQWGVAIATGCWERSARFKMKSAGLDGSDLPAAFAEDGPSREAIVRTAITRALVRYRQNDFERVVSVGDAVWDVHTAKRLELPFIGIGKGERAEVLRNHGASHVIENFLNHSDCLRCLEKARIPNGKAN